MYEPRGSFNDSRYEFENKFNILQELINKGRMNFSFQSRKTIDSLSKIRKLPNGRIDLNTIDELARTTANMTGNFEHMMKQNKDTKHEE